MQEESFRNIIYMVQDCLKDNPQQNQIVNEVFDETKIMYEDAMQRSIMNSSIIKPDVKGLESEPAYRMNSDPT